MNSSEYANLSKMSGSGGSSTGYPTEKVLNVLVQLEQPKEYDWRNPYEKINRSELLLNALLQDENVIKLLELNGIDLIALRQTLKDKSKLALSDDKGDYSLRKLMHYAMFDGEPTKEKVPLAGKQEVSPLSLFKHLLTFDEAYAAELLTSYGLSASGVQPQIEQLHTKEKQKIIAQYQTLKQKYAKLELQEHSVKSEHNTTPEQLNYQLTFDNKHHRFRHRQAEENDQQTLPELEFYAAVLTDEGLQFLFDKTPASYEFYSDKLAIMASNTTSTNSIYMSLQTKEFGNKIPMGVAGGHITMIFDDKPRSKTEIAKIVAQFPDRSTNPMSLTPKAINPKELAELMRGKMEGEGYIAIKSEISVRDDQPVEHSEYQWVSSQNNSGGIFLKADQPKSREGESKLVTGKVKTKQPVILDFILKIDSEDNQTQQFKAAVYSDQGLKLYIEQTPFELALSGKDIKVMVDAVKPVQLVGELINPKDNNKVGSFTGRRGALFYSSRPWEKQRSGRL